MSVLGFFENVAKCAVGAVAVAIVLPIAGPVGTITATGAAVVASMGGTAGAIEHIAKEYEKN